MAEGGEEASDSLKIMADKHAVIRAHLEEATADLCSKQAILQIEEDKNRMQGGQICIAEQQVRSLNEKLFYLREKYVRKEKYQQDLLSELVANQWAVTKIHGEIDKCKAIFLNNTDKQAAHKLRVESAEGTGKEIDSPEAEALQKEVDRLLSIKVGLEEGDPEIKRIWTGQALQALEIQKKAILDAFCERDIETEFLQADLDDKLKQVQQAEQKLQIEEKQNQARLRLMQKQLHELEETEKHLKTTVQYMEQQVDHGVK